MGSSHIATPKGVQKTYRSLRSVHPFLHSSPFYPIPLNLMLCKGLDTPLKVPLPIGDCITMKCIAPWVYLTQHHTRHLYQISRFCTAHGRSTTTPLYQHQPPRSTASETVNSRQWSFCSCGSRHLEQTANWCHRCKFTVNFSSSVKRFFYSGNHILV